LTIAGSLGVKKRSFRGQKRIRVYPGQYYDAETGLHYNWHRDYHPGIGRYIESDPIGTDGIINLYVYGSSSPINVVDINGLKEFKARVGSGGSVGYWVLGGAYYNAQITDMESGETCNYSVRCFGIGAGLPEINFTSKPVKFNVDDECKKCSDFEGNGYIGGASVVVGGGFTIGGGMKIPGGPFIPGDNIDWNYGGVRIGVSHNWCWFEYKGSGDPFIAY